MEERTYDELSKLKEYVTYVLGFKVIILNPKFKSFTLLGLVNGGERN